MSEVVIYHNPRCGKSRKTLELLESKGVEPEVIKYLQESPDEATLRDLLTKLGMSAADFIRRKEATFKDLGLKEKLDDEDALIAAMVDNPILIERPIVVRGDKARLGRPPENVAELFD